METYNFLKDSLDAILNLNTFAIYIHTSILSPNALIIALWEISQIKNNLPLSVFLLKIPLVDK